MFNRVVLKFVLIFVCISSIVNAQLIPRRSQITAAEYFVGSDPGAGKGNPVSISGPSVNISLNLPKVTLSQGQYVHIRVRNAQGVWSSPVALQYPTRTIGGAEVIVENNPNTVSPGQGIAMTPVSGSFGTGIVNVQANVSVWNHTDTVWVRARSSQYLWSKPVGSVTLIDTILKPVSLFLPTNRDTVQLFNPARPLVFSWSRSATIASFPMKYSLHLVGVGLDTTFGSQTDTSLTTNLMPTMKISSIYGWSVRTTDGYTATASPDSFLFRTSDGVTSVNDLRQLPKAFALYQNYPNPFNPSTVISYDLPVNGAVALRVYDILGREVETIVNERQVAGNHTATFNASNLPSGVYFYRLQAGSFVAIRKSILIK